MKANNSDTSSIYGAYMPAGGGNFQVNDEIINARRTNLNLDQSSERPDDLVLTLAIKLFLLQI